MRVALTGGASGIGAAVAAKLTGAGHEVTAFDVTEPPANVAHWIRTDLSDPSSIAAAVAAATGPYDALINNAGLPPRAGLAELILKVNYLGLRDFMRGILDKVAPGAAVVNTASRAGARWRENLDEVKALMALTSVDEVAAFVADRNIDHIRAYDLSKEAVIVLTMADTERLAARNMRVNSVSPAATATGILDDFMDAFGERAAKAVARVGRPGKPEEVADLIAFLIGPDSNWLRGQDFCIDGGTTAMVTTDMLGLAADPT